MLSELDAASDRAEADVRVFALHHGGRLSARAEHGGLLDAGGVRR